MEKLTRATIGSYAAAVYYAERNDIAGDAVRYARERLASYAKDDDFKPHRQFPMSRYVTGTADPIDPSDDKRLPYSEGMYAQPR
jgi:hypothetical protein